MFIESIAEGRNCLQRILYLAKPSFQSERNKAFPEKQKMRDLAVTGPALPEVFKGTLQVM